MSGPFPYRSPAALRAALTDRLKKLADSSPFTVTELQRQFAYDRLPAVRGGGQVGWAAVRDVLRGPGGGAVDDLDAGFSPAAGGGQDSWAPTVDYRAYPLVDHIADKVSACLETHVLGGGTVMVSSRYKDLVDLVLIARTQRPVAAQLRRALLSETARRGVGLVKEFVAPGPLWPAGYEAKAAEVPQLGELRRFPAALAFAKSMVDPVLAGTAIGRWDPVKGAWIA